MGSTLEAGPSWL